MLKRIIPLGDGRAEKEEERFLTLVILGIWGLILLRESTSAVPAVLVTLLPVRRKTKYPDPAVRRSDAAACGDLA